MMNLQVEKLPHSMAKLTVTVSAAADTASDVMRNYL